MTDAQQHIEQVAAVKVIEQALQRNMFVQYDGVHLFRFSETPLHREEDDCLAKMAAELAPKLYAELAAAGIVDAPVSRGSIAGLEARRSHLRCLPGGLSATDQSTPDHEPSNEH